MFSNRKQLEVARIFHYVLHRDWLVARRLALRATERELDSIITDYPNWRESQ